MQINNSTLTLLYKGLRTVFIEAFQGSAPQWPAIAMKVSSNKASELYYMLAALPGMKEFVSEAQIDNTGALNWQIDNKEWEDTIGVKRKDIERDSLGFYNTLMASMGVAAAEHPDELISNLLTGGFTQKDYTGTNFFDVNKPHNPQDGKSGKFSNKGTKALSADNYAAALAAIKGLKNGAGRPMGIGRKMVLIVGPSLEKTARTILQASIIAATDNVLKGSAELQILNRLGDSQNWFLMEAGLPMKPLLFQDEQPVALHALVNPEDSHVMLKQEFLYQAYGRYNAGYGLSQLIWGSTGADAA